jgi:hypothetical protein
MPILDEEHDFAHPVEGDQAWSESYYFNCYDPITDTGFYTRIGVRPNEGTLDGGLSLWLPDMQIGHIGGVRPQTTMTDNDLSVAGLRYERVSPMKEWRLSCDGEAFVRDLDGRRPDRRSAVAMDVTFSALMPAVGTDGQGREGEGASAETRKSVGKGHLEQAGRWTGWIEFDGVRHELGEGRGNRDKSWGPRRWGGPLMWRWFSINFGDNVHFGGIRIGTQAGDLHRGWVWRDGDHRSIRDWHVKTELEADALTHRVSHVEATDSDGRVHALRGDLMRVAGAPRKGTIVNEGLARWSYDGLDGYGIAEYLHQLDDAGQPRIPIE